MHWKHLKTATNVIDAAADFIIDHKRLIVVPIVYFLIVVASLILWFWTLGLVISTNDIHLVSPNGVKGYYKAMVWKPYVYAIIAFMFISILWFIAYINLSSKFVLMVSAATYYYNSDEIKEG